MWSYGQLWQTNVQTHILLLLYNGVNKPKKNRTSCRLLSWSEKQSQIYNKYLWRIEHEFFFILFIFANCFEKRDSKREGKRRQMYTPFTQPCRSLAVKETILDVWAYQLRFEKEVLDQNQSKAPKLLGRLNIQAEKCMKRQVGRRQEAKYTLSMEQNKSVYELGASVLELQNRRKLKFRKHWKI